MKSFMLVVLMGTVLLGTAYGVVCTSPTGTLVDLTTAGSSATVNGAYFTTTDSQATGTGVIQSFVRITTNDNCEQGYNTSGRPLEYDENNSPQFTRDLMLEAVPLVTIGGIQYREFLLDINQTSANSLLSLEQIEIWQAGEAGLLGFTPGGAGFGGNSATDVLRYSLDPDYFIRLDYNLNAGSGSGDMFMYVPNDAFGAGLYVYLFSEFGEHNWNNDGFEEWAVRTTSESTVIPEPTSVLLLGTVLAGLGLWCRRRFTV